jgi:hypothetical protein
VNDEEESYGARAHEVLARSRLRTKGLVNVDTPRGSAVVVASWRSWIGTTKAIDIALCEERNKETEFSAHGV